MDPPHTVNSCATDLHRLCSELGVRPDAVLGHSFGGKVAIEFTRLAVEGAAQTAPPAHTWVLDSMPGVCKWGWGRGPYRALSHPHPAAQGR